MVEGWLLKEGLPEQKPSHVPSWVDALLLVLDQAIRVQPPANVQAAKVALPLRYSNHRLTGTCDSLSDNYVCVCVQKAGLSAKT